MPVCYSLLPRHPYRKLCYGLFLGLMLLSVGGLAQVNKTDSLLTLLNKHPQQDTIRLNLLNKISRSYNMAEVTNGLPYVDKAMVLARKLNAKPQIAEAFFNMGYIYTVVNDEKKAIPLLDSALYKYTFLKDKPQITLCYLNKSKNYYAIGNYSKAFELSKMAEDMAGKTGNKLLLADCFNNSGLNLSYLADYTLAIKYYFRQLKIYEELNNDQGIAKTLGNIGMVYYGLKKYPEAIEYTMKCLPMLKQADNKLLLAAALNNIGGFYLEMGDYKQTIAYNQKALALNHIIKSRKGMANDLMDIGVSYFKLKQYRAAIDTLMQGIALYDSLGAKNNLSIALGHLANLYVDVPAKELVKLGVNPANRLSTALKLQLRSVALAQQTKDLNNESDQWKRLSTIYELNGNNKQALTSYRTYVALRDSISSDKKKQEISRLTIQYQYDKKESALKIINDRKQTLAMLEISRQKFIRNALIIIGFILMIAAAVVFVFYRRRKDALEKQIEADLRARIADTEMKALRLQLNPHFIFNSLNSIGYYINKHDKETADLYLTKFARLMRLILENSEYEEISLADDLLTLELYMQLEALRLDNKLSYQIKVDDHIDKDNVLVPPMLLQPFIENSIWHGISPKKGDGKIEVTVHEQQEMLIFSIADNGIGRERSAQIQEKRSKKNSMGLKVIQARINVINEVKQTNASVKILDTGEGTTAVITIPYQLKF
jgi:tetratricopeptide (TPR) repeat protein/two-component sensor histidine kinase